MIIQIYSTILVLFSFVIYRSTACSNKYCANCRQELYNGKLLPEIQEFYDDQFTNNKDNNHTSPQPSCFDLTGIEDSKWRCSHSQCYTLFELSLDPRDLPAQKSDVRAKRVYIERGCLVDKLKSQEHNNKIKNPMHIFNCSFVREDQLVEMNCYMECYLNEDCNTNYVTKLLISKYVHELVPTCTLCQTIRGIKIQRQDCLNKYSGRFIYCNGLCYVSLHLNSKNILMQTKGCLPKKSPGVEFNGVKLMDNIDSINTVIDTGIQIVGLEYCKAASQTQCNSPVIYTNMDHIPGILGKVAKKLQRDNSLNCIYCSSTRDLKDNQTACETGIGLDVLTDYASCNSNCYTYSNYKNNKVTIVKGCSILKYDNVYKDKEVKNAFDWMNGKSTSNLTVYCTQFGNSEMCYQYCTSTRYAHCNLFTSHKSIRDIYSLSIPDHIEDKYLDVISKDDRRISIHESESYSNYITHQMYSRMAMYANQGDDHYKNLIHSMHFKIAYEDAEQQENNLNNTSDPTGNGFTRVKRFNDLKVFAIIIIFLMTLFLLFCCIRNRFFPIHELLGVRRYLCWIVLNKI